MEEVTQAGDFVDPRVAVELESVKTRSGVPVCVLCERVGEIDFLRITESLPGGQPLEAVLDKATSGDMEMARALARPVIEAGTALQTEKGLQRPGVSFRNPPAEGAVPGGFMSDGDMLNLFKTIMVISGYMEEADEVSFRDGDTKGVDAGGGSVVAGEGGGEVPARGVGDQAEDGSGSPGD